MSAKLWQFGLLSAEEQKARIRKLAAAAWPDHDIARLTGLHVDQVRRAIATEPQK